VATDSGVNKTATSLVGEKLRQAREKKGLTIEQAQKQTHIHSTVLTALEEDRCDTILTAAYVKSFLKKYSAYLGLDSQKILNEYLASHPELATQNINLAKTEAEEPVDLSRFAYVIRSFFTLVVVVVVAIFLTKALVGHFKKPKHGKAVSSAKTKAKGVVIKLSDKKKTSTKPDFILGEDTPPDSLKGKTAISKVAIPKKTVLELVLKVKQPVLVQLRKDGNLLFKRVLQKGSVELFTAYDSINIYAAKGEAIELTLNGKYLGSPGTGLIKDLEITRRGVRLK